MQQNGLCLIVYALWAFMEFSTFFKVKYKGYCSSAQSLFALVPPANWRFNYPHSFLLCLSVSCFDLFVNVACNQKHYL